MAAGEYLKMAAANIRRATIAMQEEISVLQKNIDETERSIRNQIDNMSKQINNNKMLMANPSVSDLQRADRLRENAHLDSEMENRKHEINRHRDQNQQQIAAIERELAGLNNLATDLDRRGSA